MVKTLYSHEIETKRNELAERIYDLMKEETKQTSCSSLENCDHVMSNMRAVNFNVPEFNAYIKLVCEKYPQVCELNLNENKK